ncbi:MAG: hypothetical protein MUE46_04855 [Xanthomonadales bacterium]|jgi:hypothetical protein|nr:hypothetical protein [Xanthomonadales bacterium]
MFSIQSTMTCEAQPKRVFLSCVSREYGIDRPALKQMFTGTDIELTVQEDFERAASPVGTLGKIYRFIKACDLVVQLIGPSPPRKVPMAVAQEVLDLDPNFAAWLAQRAILPALKAEALGYTDFEAYLALYLGKAFLPIRFRRGAQPEHEAALRQLGRHVEISIDRIDALPVQIRSALEISKVIDQPGQTATAKWRQLGLDLATFTFILLAILASFILQLDAMNTSLDPKSLIDQAARFIFMFLAYFGLHLVTMGDLLALSFRLKASLRNGSAMLLGFSAIGWLLSSIDDFVSAAGATWPKLLSVAILMGVGGKLIEHSVTKASPGRLIGRAIYACAHSVALLGLLHWAGWNLDLLFWLAVFAGLMVMAFVVKRDAEDLEREREHGTSDLTPGVTENSDGYFWYDRHVIAQSRRVPDYKSKL